MLQIVQARGSVAYVGTHNFYILMDDNGHELGQLNGFSVKDGVVNLTGIGGTLQVRTDVGTAYDASTPQQIIIRGADDYIMKLWDTAKDCGVAINNKNYDYNALDTFGKNSDAAFSTLAKCMGVPEVDLGGWAPGSGDIILDSATIAYIQSLHGMKDTPFTDQPIGDDDGLFITTPPPPSPTVAQLVGVHETSLAVV